MKAAIRITYQNGGLIEPGEEIPEGLFSDEQVESLKATGAIVPSDAEEMAAEAEETESVEEETAPVSMAEAMAALSEGADSEDKEEEKEAE